LSPPSAPQTHNVYLGSCTSRESLVRPRGSYTRRGWCLICARWLSPLIQYLSACRVAGDTPFLTNTSKAKMAGDFSLKSSERHTNGRRGSSRRMQKCHLYQVSRAC
jgi:hypothetical protein